MFCLMKKTHGIGASPNNSKFQLILRKLAGKLYNHYNLILKVRGLIHNCSFLVSPLEKFHQVLQQEFQFQMKFRHLAQNHNDKEKDHLG